MGTYTANIFPGQGSQYVGMAKEFADRSETARSRMEEADDLLNVHLSKIMLEGPEDALRQTDVTQPAIFLHSVIALESDGERMGDAAVAGHSLGEYSALFAAGSMSFSDALKLVRLRGTLMAEAGRRKSGTMAAVIGMDNGVLKDLCLAVEKDMNSIVRAANFNSPGQIVISGENLGVHEVMRRAKEMGIRIAKELPVSGAFHSPLMQYAADGLKEALDSTAIEVPLVPFFANVTAEPVSDPSEIRGLLVEQLTAPVRWEETVKNLYDFGVREFVEYGPGKVLQGLVSRTVQGVNCRGVEKPMVNA
jgi:[acyl-carrier-protein] S-malonyltransferase